jgi:Nitroreductase
VDGDALALLRDRRSRAALTVPAPGPDEVRALLVAAGSAPDHGRLRPWRFVVVTGAGLGALGDAFAAAHAEREPTASPAELDRSRSKPRRAPMIVVVVGGVREHPKVPAWEQRAAVACAAYGVVLGANALGYGAMWRTSWYGEAPKVRAHLGLADGEEVTGWIYLGTPAGHDPVPRPQLEPPVTWLG